MHKKIITILIIFYTICAITFISYSADLNELQQQRNEIQNKVTETEENLQLINQNLTENLQQIQKLDTSIEENEKSINEIEKNIEQTQTEVNKIQKELNTVISKYNTQKNLLDQRLVAIYESSDTTYLDVLLSSSNLTDFISTYYLVSEIAQYDMDLLETIEKERKQIETARNSLNQKNNYLEEQRKNVVKKQVFLENSKAIRSTYLAKLSEEEQKVQAQLDEYNNQVKAIEQEIVSLAKVVNFGENYKGGKMIWPIDNHSTLTSPFSMRVHPITKVYKLHTGIDIGATRGTDFKAAANGVVVKAQYNSAYGNMVIIDHGGGVQTLYAHGDSIVAQLGQVVNAGDVVLKVGSTGYSTGPHAHFEIRINGEPVNPVDYLPGSDNENSNDLNAQNNLQ